MCNILENLKISIFLYTNFNKSQRQHFDEFTGFGKIQLIVLVVCGLILMAVINETMGMAIIIPAAQCDLELSSSRKGVISAVSFIGNLELPILVKMEHKNGEFFFRNSNIVTDLGLLS